VAGEITTTAILDWVYVPRRSSPLPPGDASRAPERTGGRARRIAYPKARRPARRCGRAEAVSVANEFLLVPDEELEEAKQEVRTRPYDAVLSKTAAEHDIQSEPPHALPPERAFRSILGRQEEPMTQEELTASDCIVWLYHPTILTATLMSRLTWEVLY
jgi:hypothetical protein